MTTTTALAANIPLMVLFLALWTGIPMWLVFKHPGRKPRAVPQYERAYAAHHAQAARAQAARTQASRGPWTASA